MFNHFPTWSLIFTFVPECKEKSFLPPWVGALLTLIIEVNIIAEDSKFLLYEELAALKNNDEIKIEANINFVKLIDEIVFDNAADV